VYELDMGDPIRILDLATRFARAHGYEPRVVYPKPATGLTGSGEARPQAEPARMASEMPIMPIMDIAITGARPGEKLHEELAYSSQSLQPTPCPGILALPEEAALTRADGERLDVGQMISDLQRVRTGVDAGLVRAGVTRYLPGFAEAAAGVVSKHNPNARTSEIRQHGSAA
jgi:FlaA1/EpsC-like NDP-sugar epimerase